MTRSILIVVVLAVFVLYSCQAEQCKGGPNDVRTECGSQCEPSCSQPGPRPCFLSCAVDVCRCKNGYYRRKSDQRCVELDECDTSASSGHN